MIWGVRPQRGTTLLADSYVLNQLCLKHTTPIQIYRKFFKIKNKIYLR